MILRFSKTPSSILPTHYLQPVHDVRHLSLGGRGGDEEAVAAERGRGLLAQRPSAQLEVLPHHKRRGEWLSE